MQRSINITSFFQSISINFSLFGSFATSQIHYIDFRTTSLCDVILDNLRLNVQSENCMRPRGFIIHGGGRSFPVLNSSEKNTHGLFIVGGIFLRKPLNKDSLFEILSNLSRFEVRIELWSWTLVPSQ